MDRGNRYKITLIITSSSGQLMHLEICQFPIRQIYHKEGDIDAFRNAFPVIKEKRDLSLLGLPKAYVYSSSIKENTSGFTVHFDPHPTLPNTGSLKYMVYVIGGSVKRL
ncbi:hypothetical protein BTO04_00400 [Polaribacter sp. SA4-10]|nr:hypothetical protein BTO04_00400 [Polaribacter sp. SA4-10]